MTTGSPQLEKSFPRPIRRIPASHGAASRCRKRSNCSAAAAPGFTGSLSAPRRRSRKSRPSYSAEASILASRLNPDCARRRFGMASFPGSVSGHSGPLHIRDLVAAVLATKRLTPDWKLTEATIKRAREALRLLRVKGVVRIVGGPVLKRCRWVLVEG